MRHRKVSLSDKSANMIPYYDFDFSENNRGEIYRMKKILSKAMDCELTERQRYCLRGYYLEGKSMREIAEELKLCPSTVTRHIQSAEKRLKRIAECYS